MSDEVEIPEVCKQYDLLDTTIYELELYIDSLKENNKELKTELKEALDLVGTALKIGEDLPTFRERIREINVQLVSNNEQIKTNSENVTIYKKELEEVKGKIKYTGMVKIHRILSINSNSWVTNEEYESIHPAFVTRLV